MRKLLVYENGSVVIVNSDNKSVVIVGRQKVVKELPATEENIKEYFPDLEPGDVVV